LNFHYPLAHSLSNLKDKEFTLSSAYFNSAFKKLFHLINTLGIYTRFLLDAVSRLSVVHLALEDSLLSHTTLGPS